MHVENSSALASAHALSTYSIGSGSAGRPSQSSNRSAQRTNARATQLMITWDHAYHMDQSRIPAVRMAKFKPFIVTIPREHVPRELMPPSRKYARIGIMGGMGPAATADFQLKLIKECQTRGATKDGEVAPHIATSLSGEIGDRTAYLMSIKDRSPEEQEAAMTADVPGNPYKGMLESLRILESCGAKVIAITCNTAHQWHKHLEQVANKETKLLHIADAVVAALDTQEEGKTIKLGLAATSGTIGFNIYQNRIAKSNRPDIEIITPDQKDQDELVMKGIYDGVKAGNDKLGREKLLAGTQALIDKGADAVSLSCTEIPLVVKQEDFPETRILDATDELVKLSLDKAEVLHHQAAEKKLEAYLNTVD